MPRLLTLLLLLPLPTLACDMLRYTRVQASPSVHVFQAAEGTTGVVNGNITAIIGRDAVLVVDTGQFHGVARKALAEIRTLTRAPVRYIVNTHWHGDHLLANSVFKEAFPEARILAHSHTIAEAAARYADYATQTARSLPGAVEAARKRGETSVSEDEKLWIARTIECAEALLPDIAATRHVAPDTPVDTGMKVDLGGLVVAIRHLGTGNTPGDLIAWVESEAVVASGDMVVAPVPYAIGSAGLQAWAHTLGKLRALGARVIVPGHGAVMRDDAYVRDLQALLEGTRTQLSALRAAGATQAEAAARLDTAQFRARHVDTPMKRQAFDQFFVKAAIAQAWK